MAIALPLQKMTVREKLAALESIWEDLARTPEVIDSPAWHKHILDERRERVTKGKAKFSDWGTAKARIRRKVS